MIIYKQIIKKIDTQIEHCKDCKDTDGQLKGFISGLKNAKNLVRECQYKEIKKQQEAKPRDWSKVNRTCIICKCKEKQGDMIRNEQGWICEDCYQKEHLIESIEEW